MTARNQVDLIFKYRVADEARFAESQELIYPRTEADEPYLIEYQVFRQPDGVHLQHERYFDEDSIWRHLEVTAAGQQAWNEATELIEVNVIGPVGEKFREAFAGPAVFFYDRVREVVR
ncbi:hypothetical protein KOI35_30315 [Actinoplanes bogorensis]|uniref:ABM domain-containing protein n=1 Tax=Paractinoplanes bogorensis TaxID=1610840 RepID=A0ABS5YWJ3_9ACTN|nr:hypothetical protein [Actinoplanes bogorensis]MBU2667814.1 hypothetical protein [Actinoplanes bogorensis]